MTDFICCTEFGEFCEEEEFKPKQIAEEYNFNYCPFCGYKLRLLH